MKKVRPAGWSGPSYSYSWRRGVVRRRRKLPIVLWTLAVGISMAFSVALAMVQVNNAPPPVKAHVAASSALPKAQQITAPTTKSIEYQNQQLSLIINRFAARHAGHEWGVQLQGLGNDERAAAYRATEDFRSASLYKLLLMYPLIQQVPFDQWGTQDLDVNGTSTNLKACVTAMLRVSNNPCGVAVGDYVGWGFADSQLKLIGLRNTTLSDPNGPRTSAADVAYYLQGLYDGKWFDGATQDFIIKTLDQQIFRTGIPAGCGSACAVADKTGSLSMARDDAGIIRYPGGAYVLSVLSDGASYADIAQLAAQIQAFMTD